MITIIDLPNTERDISSIKLPVGYELAINNTKCISLTRNFFSSIPLFCFFDKSQLFLSDSYLELVDFLKSKSLTLKPDLEYMKFYIAFQAPYTSRTLLKNINLIRPGERLEFKLNGDYKRELLTRSPSNESQYTQTEFKNSIESIIEKLNPGNTIFHISSGLDSSILAITAARVFPKNTIRLATCITRGAGCLEELVNSKRLADEIGADIIVYDFSDIDIFKEGKELIKNCLGYPIAHPSHLVEYLLDKRIVASGAKTIVNGKGPDDCLAGYPWHFEEYRLLSSHRSRMMVTSDAELFELTGGIINCQSEENYWRRADKILTLTQRLEYDALSLTEAWNIIHCAIANKLDVNVISPFMDPKIRSGLFALEDDLKINDGQNKYFLRQTFLMDYPDYILEFSKHGLRLDLRPYFIDYTSDDLLSKITCGMSSVEPYYNIKKLKEMIEMTLRGEKNYGWQLWSVFCLTTALQD